MNIKTISGPFPFTLHLVHGDEVDFNDLPTKSIALDGCVRGPTIDAEHERYSLDHHGCCTRLVTDASCMQTRRYLLVGGPSPEHVFINDVDGDVLLSLWLLLHSNMANDRIVRRLCRAVGAIDAHGPIGYAELSDEETVLANLFYSDAGIYQTTPRDLSRRFDEWIDFIRAGLRVIDRIASAELRPSSDEATFHATILKAGLVGGVRAIMIESTSDKVMAWAYREGAQVVVATEPPSGELHTEKGLVPSRIYTLAKASDLVPFSLGSEKIDGTALWRLKRREPGWGGGSSIGGSPRPHGSALTPDEVWKIVTGLE